MVALCPNCGRSISAESLSPGQSLDCTCGSGLRVPENIGELKAEDKCYLQVVSSQGEEENEAETMPAIGDEAAADAGSSAGSGAGSSAGHHNHSTPTIFKEMEGKDAILSSLAVERGFVTWNQVNDCVEAQRQLDAMGIQKSLDEVLVDKNLLSTMQAMRLREEASSGKKLNEIGGFRITGRLGKGGMGTVYRAKQISLQRDVALKILPRHLASDHSYIERFLMEARSAAKLRHPNIVQAIDVGEDKGFFYFAMELIEGQSSMKLLEKFKVLPPRQAAIIVGQISRALEHASDRSQMIHRDIKPDNILIDTDGTAKLADMGLSKSQKMDKNLTHSGTIIGTPNYISPEQAEGRKEIDQRADIYSLGCTLYHYLTGKAPFDADSAALILLGHMTKPRPDPREAVTELPDQLAEFTLKMMAQDPNDRPQTASEVAEFMEQFASEEHGPGTKKSQRAEEEKPASARPVLHSGDSEDDDSVSHVQILMDPNTFELEADDDEKQTGAAAHTAAADPGRSRSAPAETRKQTGLTKPAVTPEAKVQAVDAEEDGSTSMFWFGPTGPTGGGPVVAPRRRKQGLNIGLMIAGGVMVLVIVIVGIVLLKPEKQPDVPVPPRLTKQKEVDGGKRPTVPKDTNGGKNNGEENGAADPAGKNGSDSSGDGSKTPPTDPGGERPKPPVDDPGPDPAPDPNPDPVVEPDPPKRPPHEPPEWASVSHEQIAYSERTKLPVAEEFELAPEVSLRVVLIPPGSFTMGSPADDAMATEFERPQHIVQITTPFYAGVYEITQKQYEAIMGENPAEEKHYGETMPVEGVRRSRALIFCRRLSRRLGREVTLPTEAQWEYMCRAGSQTRFSFGDGEEDFLHRYAWVQRNAENQPHPVGQKQPNKWGLYDLHGNVSEWCLDVFDKDYYAQSPMEDPTGPENGDLFVYRGGHYKSASKLVRSASRSFTTESGRAGLRVVIAPPGRKLRAQAPSTELQVSEAQRQEALKHRVPSLKVLELPGQVQLPLVIIPAGLFKMGNRPEAPGWKPDQAEHDVRITRPYYMSAYEITQAQYRAVMGLDSTRSAIKGRHLPVQNVSFNQARSFCEQLGRMTGLTVRLPSEAEWERAARAGTTTPWYFGRDEAELPANAWFRANSQGKPHPVGLRKPNPYALFDIHGNVAEWCGDWYDAGFYEDSLIRDPSGPGKGSERVVRGGSFEDAVGELVVGVRGHLAPAESRKTIGFRIVVELPVPPAD